MPGYRLTAWLRPLLTLAAMAGVLSLAACGGGGGAPSQVLGGGTTPVTVTPSTATVYSGTPSTFLISGGTKPYTILTSDQSALPVVGTLNSNTLLVTPGAVGADTSVTMTVRDAAGQQTTATVTVKPSLLLPASITITGNPNCGGSGATLCSGQDGLASVQELGPAGAPQAGRPVRFDVVQGDFGLSSTAPGQPVVQSLTVDTDQNGNAAVRIVVPSTAPTQIATIRATDVTGGSSVVGQFTIAQFVNGNSVLSVIPTGTTTFTGPDTTHCSSGASATFYVFGGTPPYTIATNFPQAITISGNPVQRSGGGFTITTNGVCFTGLTFAITDSTGRVLLTPPTADNVFGTAEAPQPLTVAPQQSGGSSGSPVDCVGKTFGYTVTGKAPFSAVVSDPLATVDASGLSASPGVLRVSGLTAGENVSITIGDASSPQNIDVEKIFCAP